MGEAAGIPVLPQVDDVQRQALGRAVAAAARIRRRGLLLLRRPRLCRLLLQGCRLPLLLARRAGRAARRSGHSL